VAVKEGFDGQRRERCLLAGHGRSRLWSGDRGGLKMPWQRIACATQTLPEPGFSKVPTTPGSK